MPYSTALTVCVKINLWKKEECEIRKASNEQRMTPFAAIQRVNEQMS